MNLLTRWTRRGNAQAAYFKADKRAGKVVRELEHATEPAERAQLLGELAGLEYAMAAHNAVGWKDSKDEDGFTLTESHRGAARITQLIAATETGHVHNRGRAPEWEPAIGDVLDRLAVERNVIKRAGLLDELYVAIHPLVGSQAAEVIETLRRTYLRIAIKYPADSTAKH
jgi:hypothetical protein